MKIIEIQIISDARRRANTPTNDDNNDIIIANINNDNNRNEDTLRDILRDNRDKVDITINTIETLDIINETNNETNNETKDEL